MGVLSGCEPQKVFDFFELLSSVPHGSGNTKAISDLCVAFARERGLEWHQDELNNVIIVKEASPGYEAAESVILQGHLDMVCAKTDDCPIDMAREPISLYVDGDWVRARDTSLGGDNAIAVAMALAILDSDELPHPRLEAVFTVEEETGMDGAAGLDASLLRGRKMLNLDSEDEGVFTVSCAGGVRVNGVLPVRREGAGEGFARCRVTVSGLQGGHSGIDINKGRGSSNQLMGRFLHAANRRVPLRLCSLEGGLFDNVIPLVTEAEVLVPASRAEELRALAGEYEAIYRSELAASDANVCVTVSPGTGDTVPITAEDTARALFVLLTVPYHVQAMSMDIPGLVQTSLNLGILRLEEGELRCSFSVRSSLQSQKEAVAEKLRAIFESAGGSVSLHGNYPGWAYRQDSPLRELVLQVYREQTGKEGVVNAIHAGLECGLFCEKLPGLDCLSMGPDLPDVHSVRERLSISSTARLYALVCEVLRRSR